MADNVTLSEEQYKTFLKIVTTFKETCVDLDIREGKIFQKSNDFLHIYQCDVTSLIGGNSFPISNIKSKLNLLKLFKAPTIYFQEDKVRIVEDKFYIDFVKPMTEYLDNKYLQDTELSSLVKVDDEYKIGECVFDRDILNKMKVIAQNFSTDSLSIYFDSESEKINFIIRTMIQDQKALLCEAEMNENVTGETSIPLFYNLRIPHAKIEIFFPDKEAMVLFYKITSQIEDVGLTIYSKSKLTM